MLGGKTVGMIGFGHIARAITARPAAWSVMIGASPKMSVMCASSARRSAAHQRCRLRAGDA
jgi:phosphoglycerate dehydrogenase-like enzyme